MKTHILDTEGVYTKYINETNIGNKDTHIESRSIMKHLEEQIYPPLSFVLNTDFSVYSANEEFYNIFETNMETFTELYQNQFRFALSFHHQAYFLEKVEEQTELSQEFSQDVEIVTATGALKRFILSVKASKWGEAGEKFLCSLMELSDSWDMKKQAQPLPCLP